jgi:branched-chain amino acid aminotransferase
VALPHYAYFGGKSVPHAEAKVGVMPYALNCDTGAFGGVRGYWNADEKQLFIFRPIDHFMRIFNSAKLLSVVFDYTPEDLRGITMEVLQPEVYREDVDIRPLIL